MGSQKTRQDIITIACDFNTSGLSAGKSGNLSVRREDGFLITPTGISYDQLIPDNIVHCDQNGRVISGDFIPSSEWPFHAAIYEAREEVNAVVHVHSPYATALACTRKPIPAFHYMIAVAGGNTIPCADYATFGSSDLSKNIVTALAGHTACLMANHGMVAVGDSLVSAYNLTHEVEALAKRYCISLQCGGPVFIDDIEMETIVEKFKIYGKQNKDN